MLRSGIAASGCALFIMSTLLAYAAFILSGLAAGLPVTIRGSELALFIGSFILFETAYFFYITNLIRRNLRSITEIRHPALRFAIDCSAIAACFLSGTLIVKADISPAAAAPVLLSISFCAGLFFLSAARIIAYFLLVRLLCERAGFLPMLSEGGTVTLERLIELTERLYNYCARFNIPLSFVGIRVNIDPAEFKTSDIHEHELFIRQIAFLLAENSRNYEPWALRSEISSFLCIVQARDNVELDTTIKRFEAIIRKASPFYLKQGYTPELHVISETFTASLYDKQRADRNDEIIQRTFGRIIDRLAPGGRIYRDGGDL
jgi:hypothetical protein